MPWEKVTLTWGDTSKNLPWSCNSGGSQTTHAMTRAAHAGGHRRHHQAAADRREGSGRETRGLRSERRAGPPQGAVEQA
jgi:hypothetical protein